MLHRGSIEQVGAEGRFSSLKRHIMGKVLGNAECKCWLKRPDSSTTNSLAHSLPPSTDTCSFSRCLCVPLLYCVEQAECPSEINQTKKKKGIVAKICPQFYCLCLEGGGPNKNRHNSLLALASANVDLQK